MTLILGMSKAEGIYLSVDYRVTRGGRLVGDAAVKYLWVHYPPPETGPRALFAYTGLATVFDGTPDATPTGRWLRETLRGESEYFDQSMAHLRERLNRDVGGHAELIVNVLVLEGERRLLGGLTNIWRRDPSRPFRVQNTFNYVLQELTEPAAFGNGSGARRVIADGHFDRMKAQLGVVPRRAHDHMCLLATINRRVAAVDDQVSPFCYVTFVSTDEKYPSESKTFVERGESVLFEMPVMVFGIDLTDSVRAFAERSAEFFRGGPPPGASDPELMRRGTERRR